VKGNIIITGVDAGSDLTEVSQEKLKVVDMLWDIGAYQTVISGELLSEEFRQYLRDKRHDSYRLSSGTRVLMDPNVRLGAHGTAISCPDQRFGVILGRTNAPIV